MSIKYKGIKFPKPPPKGLFTIVDDTCKNLKADVTWQSIEYEVNEAHKTNKDIFAKKGQERLRSLGLTIPHSLSFMTSKNSVIVTLTIYLRASMTL